MKLLSAATDGQWISLDPPTKTDDLTGQDDQQLLQQFEKNNRLLKQVLSETLLAESVSVLSGLGTSMGVEKAPSMPDLWDAVKAREKTEAFAAMRQTVSHPSTDENIELLLSRCQLYVSVHPDNDITAFINRAENVIVEKIRFLKDGGELPDHEQFLRTLARRPIQKGRAKIFTTNYDLCFEYAASRTRLVLVDGFSHTMPQTFDSSHFSYDFVQRRDNGRDAPTYIPNVVHLYKLHGSIDWTRSRDPSSPSEIRKQLNPDRPLMIYPRGDKFQLSYEHPFFDLMAHFQTALRQPNTALLVVGVGFSDFHISQPIMSAVRSNVSMRLVVASRSLEKRAADNSDLKTLVSLIKANDARITLIDSTFQELVQAIPDLAPVTEHERHSERIRTVAKGAPFAP